MLWKRLNNLLVSDDEGNEEKLYVNLTAVGKKIMAVLLLTLY